MGQVHAHVAQQQRDRVGLLTARTAGTPDADRVCAVAPAIGQHRRDQMMAQEPELRRIAQEAGLRDGDEMDQLAEFVVCRIAAEALVIGFPVAEPELAHPDAHRRLQRGLPALPEEQPAPALDEVAEACKMRGP
jgi:hypothetical protein